MFEDHKRSSSSSQDRLGETSKLPGVQPSIGLIHFRQ